MEIQKYFLIVSQKQHYSLFFSEFEEIKTVSMYGKKFIQKIRLRMNSTFVTSCFQVDSFLIEMDIEINI